MSRGFEKKHYVCRVSANGDHAVANGYRVDLETLTCTCMDFKFNAMPYKHVFAVMHHVQGDMQLPIQYRTLLIVHWMPWVKVRHFKSKTLNFEYYHIIHVIMPPRWKAYSCHFLLPSVHMFFLSEWLMLSWT